ncbi:MAG: flagellar basal body-associated FliL family protein [Rhodospirillales bacterium]|nr:flagellar basal body-associated FliL family protein [Rhodospirillales bacterium]
MATATSVEPSEAEAEAPAEAPAPTRSRRRLLILAGAPLLACVIGAGLWFSGVLPRLIGQGRPVAAATGKPVLFAMPEMVANLAGSGSVQRYVKVDIQLVAANPAALAVVRKDLPQLQDMFLTYLRDMHASEMQSSVGTWRLREALLARAAIVAGPGRVTNVLFTNLLIQ